MNIKVFARNVRTGEAFEVRDLYWFEEQGIHDFGGDGHHGARYRLQIMVDDNKVFDNLAEDGSSSLDKTEPECDHKFFKCQVPAGDSCQPIYHEVCKVCRWDRTKGCVMPDYVWFPWAVLQLKKLEVDGK